MGIPRSTLQYWLKRNELIDADPEVIAFFESPAGIAFLHRLVLGAHFTITLLGASSVRHVCQFLELTGLDRFVGSSYGSQQKVSVQMENAVIKFGKQETDRLATGMKTKEISVCQDETFHPETCLVAIEPNANFILLEKYSGGRKGSDWTESMQEATKDLPVQIIQSTSDEGKGILHHVKKGLGAHHSPDVFHIQHEIVKGTSGPLSKKTQKARQNLEKASEEVNRCIDSKVTFDAKRPCPGRPPQFNMKIEKALLKEANALHGLEKAESHQAKMKEVISRIGDLYHPVDLETGELKTADDVSDSLNQCFAEIETIAAEAELSEQSFKRIRKAKRVVADMIATIVFFHLTIQRKVAALLLSPALESLIFEKLIPAFYLRHASEKAKAADTRHRLRKKSEDMLASLKVLHPNPLAGIPPGTLAMIEEVADECARLFQRSSSCVEGRNGQLSLRHHSFHRLSDRKLAALTTVHNFFLKRQDNTTAAERFFDQKPMVMFDFLLENVNLPGRPAQKRRRPPEKKFLKTDA